MRRLGIISGILAAFIVITILAGCKSNATTTTTTTAKATTTAQATTSAPATTAAKPILKIGIAANTSGAYASYGDRMTKGSKMAADEINASGNYPFTVQLVFADSGGDPATAVNAVTKLITQDNVAALALPTGSSLDLATQPVLIQNGIGAIAADANTAAIATQSQGHIFMTQITTAQTDPALINWLATKLKPKGYFIITLNTDSGNTDLSLQKAAIATTGLNLAGSLQIDSTLTDASPIVAKIKQSGADTVFLGVIGAEQAQIAIALQDAGLKVQLLDVSYNSADTWANGKQAVDGMICFSPFFADYAAPKTQAFTAKYRSLYNVAPETHAADIYDGVYAIAEAAKAAGSLDRAAIMTALGKVNFVGANGTIAFTSDGLRKDPLFVPNKYDFATNKFVQLP